jgi:hypothetical protein
MDNERKPGNSFGMSGSPIQYESAMNKKEKFHISSRLQMSFKKRQKYRIGLRDRFLLVGYAFACSASGMQDQ